MNKKAQYELRKTIFWMILSTVFTIAIIGFAIQIFNFQKNVVDVPDQIKTTFIIDRFINSPDCLAYQKGDRTYPGIIDPKKFTETKLRECYPVDDKKEPNFGLKLTNINQEITTTKYYLNNRDYTIYKNILVKKGDQIQPALLEVGVQVKT